MPDHGLAALLHSAEAISMAGVKEVATVVDSEAITETAGSAPKIELMKASLLITAR